MTNRTEVSFEDFPVTGSVTGTFLGAHPTGISFVGSASFAPSASFAQISFSGTFASTASNVGPNGIVSGANLVVANVAPFTIGFNSTLGSFTNLTRIDETIAEIGDRFSRGRLDLVDYNEGRIVVAMQVVDGKGAPVQMAAQWSLDEVFWKFFSEPSESAGAFLTSSNITAFSNYSALVSESKTDVFIRIATYNGPSVGSGATAKIGSIFISFR